MNRAECRSAAHTSRAHADTPAASLCADSARQLLHVASWTEADIRLSLRQYAMHHLSVQMHTDTFNVVARAYAESPASWPEVIIEMAGDRSELHDDDDGAAAGRVCVFGFVPNCLSATVSSPP